MNTPILSAFLALDTQTLVAYGFVLLTGVGIGMFVGIGIERRIARRRLHR